MVTVYIIPEEESPHVINLGSNPVSTVICDKPEIDPNIRLQFPEDPKSAIASVD